MHENIRLVKYATTLGILAATALFAGPTHAAGADGVISVLDTHYRWATHITMLTPVMRNEDGTLAPLPPDAFGRYEKVVDLRSDPPPAEWTQPDFDDGAWPRAPGPYPLLGGYAFGSIGHAHHFALFCMRGKFLVEDPVKAAGMKLSLTYRGGAVVYLNGKEIARGHMPEGKIAFDTPALDYPNETYVDSQGGLVPTDFDCKKNKEHTERAALRTRRIDDLAVPVSALRKGVNVLALELHRAPLSPAYAPRARGRAGLWVQIGFFGLSLTAPQGAPVSPGGSAPKDLRVFNALAPVSLHNLDRFDPWEPLQQMTLMACRNAGASGQVVVYGPKPIKGAAASVSHFESTNSGNKARIPASAVEIRYALPDLAPDGQEAERFPTERGTLRELRRHLRRFDALEEEAPEEVPLSPTGDVAVLPVWLTVNVPRDAAPGKYTAVLQVKAEGMKATSVPVELDVHNVVVPDRERGASYAGIVQSPDTLVLKYGVQRWSEEHWRLIARSFRPIGRLGGDFVVVPLVRGTFYGNEESMVRWVRGKDGAFRHDLRIFERYLDCAIAESGPPRIVCLVIWEPINAYNDPGPEGRGMKMEVTVLHGDGSIGSAPVPDWGTAECRAFWKPVFDDIRKVLVARKLEAAMCAGNAAQAPPGKVVLDDLEEISPGLRWFALRHEWWDKIGPRETAVSVGVYGTPGRSGPGKKYAYAWQDPRLWAVWPRTSTCSVRENSTPLFYRVFMDRVMIAGTSGIGNIGGDFWEVVKSADGRPRTIVRGNWVQLTMGGWGTPARIIAAGAKGPIGTARLEMLREGIQDAEVRILIEKALVDPAKLAKLGPAWEQRAREALDRYAKAIILAHPGGGKGFGGTFHDSFTWFAHVLPAERKLLYGVAAVIEEAK